MLTFLIYLFYLAKIFSKQKAQKTAPVLKIISAPVLTKLVAKSWEHFDITTTKSKGSDNKT